LLPSNGETFSSVKTGTTPYDLITVIGIGGRLWS
jgi:hypothetical protein